MPRLRTTALALFSALVLGAGLGFAAEDEANPTAPPETGVIRLTPDAVQRVKETLKQRGYTFKNEGGALDDEMRAHVAKLQRDFGLESTGELDVWTLHTLGFDAAVGISPEVKGFGVARVDDGSLTRPAGMPQTAAIVGSGKDPIGFVILGPKQLAAIQQRLEKLGYYRGDADGSYSRELVNAMRRFQEANALKLTTGGIDLATLARIPEADVQVRLAEKAPPAK